MGKAPFGNEPQEVKKFYSQLLFLDTQQREFLETRFQEQQERQRIADQAAEQQSRPETGREEIERILREDAEAAERERFGDDVVEAKRDFLSQLRPPEQIVPPQQQPSTLLLSEDEEEDVFTPQDIFGIRQSIRDEPRDRFEQPRDRTESFFEGDFPEGRVPELSSVPLSPEQIQRFRQRFQIEPTEEQREIARKRGEFAAIDAVAKFGQERIDFMRDLIDRSEANRKKEVEENFEQDEKFITDLNKDIQRHNAQFGGDISLSPEVFKIATTQAEMLEAKISEVGERAKDFEKLLETQDIERKSEGKVKQTFKGIAIGATTIVPSFFTIPSSVGKVITEPKLSTINIKEGLKEFGAGIRDRPFRTGGEVTGTAVGLFAISNVGKLTKLIKLKKTPKVDIKTPKTLKFAGPQFSIKEGKLLTDIRFVIPETGQFGRIASVAAFQESSRGAVTLSKAVSGGVVGKGVAEFGTGKFRFIGKEFFGESLGVGRGGLPVQLIDIKTGELLSKTKGKGKLITSSKDLEGLVQTSVGQRLKSLKIKDITEGSLIFTAGAGKPPTLTLNLKQVPRLTPKEGGGFISAGVGIKGKGETFIRAIAVTEKGDIILPTGVIKNIPKLETDTFRVLVGSGKKTKLLTQLLREEAVLKAVTTGAGSLPKPIKLPGFPTKGVAVTSGGFATPRLGRTSFDQQIFSQSIPQSVTGIGVLPSRVRTADGLIFAPRVRDTSRVSVIDLSVQSDVEKIGLKTGLKLKARSKARERELIKQFPISITSPKEGLKLKQLQRQLQKTRQTQKLKQLTTLTTPTISTTTPTISTASLKVPLIPLFIFPLDKKRRRKGKKKKGRKGRQDLFTPGFTARALGITGKLPTGITSGIGIRPIPIKKKKKKRRKK